MTLALPLIGVALTVALFAVPAVIGRALVRRQWSPWPAPAIGPLGNLDWDDISLDRLMAAVRGDNQWPAPDPWTQVEL